jgi:DNA-binding NarL/FixJ family response regulator
MNIVITEDLPQLAQALKQKIELAVEFNVKHIAQNGLELISYLQKDHHVDVILMDINMPKMNGIEATKIVSERWPMISIVMCTVFDDEHYLFEAIMAGANGYLLKDEPPQKIHKSIYETLEGGVPMSSEIARKSLGLIRNGKPKKEPNLALTHNLTAREIEILQSLSKGLSYEQIANNLYISYGTVRKHIENCYRKLRVHSKIEAINKLKSIDE